MWLLRAFAELLAPTGCAACDAPIAPNALFCAPCAASVEPTRDPAGVFAYGGAIADAIRRLKFGDRPDLAARLARAMPPRAPRAIDAVVPVPLHPNRLAARGYNQASLLARPIAAALGARFAPRAVRRVRDTPMQSTLGAAERTTNVIRAFEADPRAVGPAILLVDDVRTTGSTLRACADALHEVGVRRVFPLVLACGGLCAL